MSSSRRRRLTHIFLIEMTAWAVIIFIAVANSLAHAATPAAATAPATAFALPRESHVPGGVITFTIAASADDRPKVTFRGVMLDGARLDGVPAMVVR